MKTAVQLIRTMFGVALFAALGLPFSASPVPDDDCLPKYPPPPVVKINVRVAARSEPGRNLEYRICVENCSTSEAHHVIVKNALPANAKFVKAEPKPSKQEPELQWNLGTVGGGGVREIVLVLQPTNKEDVKNCARVQFEHGQCVVTRQTAYQPGGARPPVIQEVPGSSELPMLDLSIRGPEQQYANLPAKYEITLTNKGKGKATDVVVSTQLPKELIPAKTPQPSSILENRVTWKLGTLEAGASRIVELNARATEKGVHCFTVEALAADNAHDEKKICTKFLGASAMRLEMIGREGVVFVGHKMSYRVTIHSQASEPLTNIKLRAFVPDAMRVERANVLYDKQEPIKGGQWIVFKTLPQIDGGSQVRYEIFVEALRAGVTRFQIDVSADQLDAGPVVEQEITNIVDDRAKGP